MAFFIFQISSSPNFQRLIFEGLFFYVKPFVSFFIMNFQISSSPNFQRLIFGVFSSQ